MCTYLHPNIWKHTRWCTHIMYADPNLAVIGTDLNTVHALILTPTHTQFHPRLPKAHKMVYLHHVCWPQSCSHQSSCSSSTHFPTNTSFSHYTFCNYCLDPYSDVYIAPPKHLLMLIMSQSLQAGLLAADANTVHALILTPTHTQLHLKHLKAHKMVYCTMHADTNPAIIDQVVSVALILTLTHTQLHLKLPKPTRVKNQDGVLASGMQTPIL